MLSELNPRDIQGDGVRLSSEEMELLRDYNLRIQQGEIFSYDEDVDNILEYLLVLRPFNPALFVCRVDLLSLKSQALDQNYELLSVLNTLLSLESFLSDQAMNFDQIRMRALRSQIYLEKQAPDIALPDLAYIIEHVHPVQEEHYLFRFYYDALHARSTIYKAQGRLEAELSDLNALLTPPALYSQKHFLYAPYGNLHNHSQYGLYRRSEMYVQQKNYDRALRDLDALLYENPWDAPALMLRSQVYQMLHQHEQAFQDEVAVHECMLSCPIYQKKGETQPLMLKSEEFEPLNHAEEQVERVIPSLQAFAKMTFFRHEANMDTSAWAASGTMSAYSVLKNSGITPETLHSMRSSLLMPSIDGEKTVFEELERCELAAEDWDVGLEQGSKKRKYDAISPSMS